MSTSPTRMLPPAIAAPRRVWPSSARPTVVLPEPDSPTRPSTSPGAIVNETSSTMSISVSRSTMRRPSTATAGLDGAHSAARPRSMPMAARASAVADEARADREHRDRDDRQHDAPRLGDQRELVLVDHRAPVGAVRVGREAEEGERRDQPDRVRQPQARLDHQRREDVGQDLAEQDPPARDAERLGGGHEVALDDGLRGAARDARDARHRRQPDGEHDQPVLGADRRDRDEREHDLREGQDDVHGAHQHVVEEVARVRGDEADEDAEHEAEDRRDRRDGEQLAAAPEEAAPDVLAEVVRAEEQVRRARVGLADERRRRVRREIRADHGDAHERRPR